MSYTDDLKTLILDHDRTIAIYEERLTAIQNETEMQAHLIRTQVEFCLLNVRGLKLSREQELESHLRMEEFQTRAIDKTPAAFYMPAYPGPIAPKALDITKQDLLDAATCIRASCKESETCQECSRLVDILNNLSRFFPAFHSR